MTLYTWSKTGPNNSTADSTINWAEGQSPSSVNDSARATMAAVAKFRDDNNGSITTGGTSTAYTATSNQAFDTLAHLDQQQITIVPHTTSGLSPTLNLDILGAKPMRQSSGVSLPIGSLVQGTPYRFTYYNTAGEFILHDGVAAIPGNFSIGGTFTVTGQATLISDGSSKWIVQSLRQAPQVSVFASGTSQTYTTPVGALYLRVRMVGGGGGGAAAATNNGSVGTDTSFGTWTAIHGNGGVTANTSTGGGGGTGGVNGTGTLIARINGGQGSSGGTNGATAATVPGGAGGNGVFGGGGAAGGGTGAAGQAGAVNTGAGGGSNGNGGGGGGAGEYVEFIITSPPATVTYTVGSGGNDGSAGSQAGGNGAAGRIEVIAYFQ